MSSQVEINLVIWCLIVMACSDLFIVTFCITAQNYNKKLSLFYHPLVISY